MPKYLFWLTLLANLGTFSTIDNRDEFNFELDAKSSDKAFTCIRKNNNPCVEPCGASALITALEECFPFGTFCFS